MQSKSARLVRWARRARRALLRQLGGKCAQCGRRGKGPSWANLHLHHRPGTRTWRAERVNRWYRVMRYRQDAQQGVLTVLCRKCHYGEPA